MTKNELKKYRQLVAERDNLRERIEKLELEITSPKIQIITDMPKCFANADKSSVIDTLIDLKRHYKRLWKKCVIKCHKIEKSIEKLVNPTERMILRYYYIDGLKWEEVCVRINYEYAHVHRLHKTALKKLKHDTK
jgi:DNA-directed RNA polymerase specialized sigma subunit